MIAFMQKIHELKKGVLLTVYESPRNAVLVSFGGFDGSCLILGGQMMHALLSWYVALKVVFGGVYSPYDETSLSFDTQSFRPRPIPACSEEYTCLN
jgi:hypothetical protein|eukprot:COSAG06_NODE_3136_length_5804_cov_2.662752_8_plen_96_part_00